MNKFYRYIFLEENPNFYKTKLTLLEKLGFYVKKPRLFKLIQLNIWESFADLIFDYEREISSKFDKIQKQ